MADGCTTQLSAAVLAECAELQHDELLALESILPAEQFSRTQLRGRDVGSAHHVVGVEEGPVVRLSCPISFAPPTRVRVIVSPLSAAEVDVSFAAGAARDTQASQLGSQLSAMGGVINGSITESPPTKQRHRQRKKHHGLRPTRQEDACDGVPLAAPPVQPPTAPVFLTLSHLPPLQLVIRLPPSYPTHAPPQILSIDSAWLSRSACSASLADTIRDKLLEMWNSDRAEVLFAWSEWLKDGMWDQAKALLSVSGGAEDDEGCEADFTLSDVGGDITLAAILERHNLHEVNADFAGESFDCTICLESKRGAKCTRVQSCAHVFCSACLSGYLSLLIVEGFHRQAERCPHPDCVKAQAAAETAAQAAGPNTAAAAIMVSAPIGRISSSELHVIVGESLASRHSWLVKKSLAESDPTASQCPRPGCDGIAARSREDEGTHYEQMRQCHCGMVWCHFCGKTWHGRSPCALSHSTTVVTQYLSHEEGSAERQSMEQRYGRANLLRMVADWEEERANAKFMDEKTTPCPCCHVRIEKSYGCNHMTCRACNTHYCHRCAARLNPREPYRHFNTPGTACFQKLFESVTTQPEVEWDRDAFAPEERAEGDEVPAALLAQLAWG